MSAISVRTVLAASSTAEPLTGTQFEFPESNCIARIAMQTDATGVLATVTTGSETQLEESPVQLGTINVQPKYPDDFYIEVPVIAGERLKIKLRDTSGAQRIVQTVVKLDEV